MDIDLNSRSPGARYALMTQTFLPRPVAWVLSANRQGSLNLAPFSYFMPVGSRPPMLAFSVGKRADGTPKDTSENILATERFVVHIAHRELLEPLNASAKNLPPGESEVDYTNLETTAWDFPVPRLSAARVAYGCVRHDVIELGDGPQRLVVGIIERMFVDDAITTEDAKGRLKIDAKALDPIARLGSTEYGLLGDIIDLPRP